MRPLLAIALLLPLTTVTAGEKLYKCTDADGKIEYSNVACKGKPQVFDASKGKGSVTRVTVPKVDPAVATKPGGPLMTPEQKKQMEELGIKPMGTTAVKPLVIPESWLK